jgi:hypothetical protein
MTDYSANVWNDGDEFVDATKINRLEATAVAHTHSGYDITSGVVDVAWLPTGTSSTTVALGDHTHGAGYVTVADEGSTVTQRDVLNFVGRPVEAVDNSGDATTDVTVLDTVPVHTVGAAGASLTLDAAADDGPIKTITLDDDCTLTFSAVTSGREIYMVLVLTQDGTGGWTVTWPGSVVWPSGGVPVLTTTAGGIDRLVVTTYDGGSTWFGGVIGKAYA